MHHRIKGRMKGAIAPSVGLDVPADVPIARAGIASSTMRVNATRKTALRARLICVDEQFGSAAKSGTALMRGGHQMARQRNVRRRLGC
jgi:hypothetical protein